MPRTFPSRHFAQSERKPEAVFASAVMKYLRQAYGQRLWEVGIRGGLGMRSGIPDRLLCVDGAFIGLEFKNPDGKGRLGPKQRLEIDKIRQSGGMALVVQSWDDLKPLFAKFEPTQREMR